MVCVLVFSLFFAFNPAPVDKNQPIEKGASITADAGVVSSKQTTSERPAVIPETPKYGSSTTGNNKIGDTASSLSKKHDNSKVDYKEGVVLVKPADNATIKDISDALGVDPSRVTKKKTGLVEIRTPENVSVEEAVKTLENSHAIKSAQPDFKYELQDDGSPSTTNEDMQVDVVEGKSPTTQASVTKPNDKRVSEQWALESIHAFDAWDLMKGTTTKPVTIAVLDEGFEIAHSDLKNNIVQDSQGNRVVYNATDGSRTMTEIPSRDGHGTHVAGIVSAQANNDIGVAGVSNNQKFLPIKVFDKNNDCYCSYLCDAFDYVLKNKDKYNIRVINLSVGIQTESENVIDENVIERIDKAYKAGIVTVCSSGNIESDTPTYNFPSDYEKVVAVIGLDLTDSGIERSATSNYNVTVNGAIQRAKDISAPGTWILSTYPSNTYLEKTGSSMAAPHVAGTLALMFAAKPSLTPASAVSTLYSTAKDLGETGFDAQTGYGEVDTAAAVAKVLGKTYTPPNEGSESGDSNSSGESSSDPSNDPTLMKTPISKTTVGQIATRYYTGERFYPKPRVSFHGKTLKEGTDYRLSYSNNKNIGTAKVFITGRGMYAGEKVVTFRIIAKPVYTVGASRMPVGAFSSWELKHCKMKVISGKGVVSISKSGKTVKALKRGTAKIAIYNNAGKKVKTRTIAVYPLKGMYCIRSAADKSVYLGVIDASKANNAPLVGSKKRAGVGTEVKLVRKGFAYQVKYMHSKKLMMPINKAKGPKWQVVQAKSDGSKAQLWRIVVDKKNRISFKGVVSHKVVALKGVHVGASVLQRVPTGGAAEKWKIYQQ